MVHEADALADLPDKHHTVYFCQVVVVVDDSFKELSAFHTAWGWTAGSPGALCPVSPSCRAPWPPCRPPAQTPQRCPGTHNSMKRMISRGVSMAS